MTALLTGLASLLVFSSVILVHELGHFMAARHCGIHVEEFSIGFGPCLWSTTRDGTTYSVRLLPLGGYNLFSPCLTRRTTRRTRAGRAHRRPPRNPAKPRFSRWSSAARNLRMPPLGSAFLSRSAVR